MSRIRGKDTKLEIKVRSRLFQEGFRFRKNDKRYPGKPDIVLPKFKTIIFINGCFWHGHNHCKYFVIPKTRTEFWLKKINTTKEKDKKHILSLKKMGWKVIVLWECQLKKDLEGSIQKMKKNLIK